MRRHKAVTYGQSLGIFIEGAEKLVYISIVLVLAWTLSSVTDNIVVTYQSASRRVNR